MTELEKVEKLREKANVSYEEAKQALAQANGDLLDAIVLLEQQGKVKAPSQSSFSTGYEEQKEYVSVAAKVNESKNSTESFWTKFKRVCGKIWKKGNENFFCVSRNGEEVFRLPVWVFLLIILLTWQISLIAMVVALFFNIRFSINGRDNLEGVNKAFDKAGDVADKVKEEINK